MKRKWVIIFICVLMFAAGFRGSGWVRSIAKNYESGSQENPLASKSYLEISVEKELRKMEIEVKELSDRVNFLQQELQR